MVRYNLTVSQKVVVVSAIVTVLLTLLGWFVLWWDGILTGLDHFGIQWWVALPCLIVLFVVIPRLTSFCCMLLGIWAAYTLWDWWFIAACALYMPTIATFIQGLVFQSIVAVFEVLLTVVTIIFGNKS